MRNTKKKGFTIVELVVVVAVIAILAAVLIPTFSGIIKKARLNADEQTVANMNKYVAAAAAEEEFVFAADAVNALYANGFNMGKFETFSKGYHYAYDFENNKFYLLDAEANVVFPAKSDKTAADLWGFFNNSKADKIANVTKYIALAPIGVPELFNAYDCVFAGNTPYTLDLNKYTISVPAAEGQSITLLNGTVVEGDVATSYGTLGNGAVAKEALSNDLTALAPVDGVVTIENKLIAPVGTYNGVSKLKIADGATAVVFKGCTINQTAIANVKVEGVKNVTFDNCVINLPADDKYQKALDIIAVAGSNLTITNCYISSARGIIIYDEIDNVGYDKIVIENNVFANYDAAKGKPSIQFATKSGKPFEANSISIKGNTFVSGKIAIRIHEYVKDMVCSNVVISGNIIPDGMTAVSGDGTVKSDAIAAEWAAKVQ